MQSCFRKFYRAIILTGNFLQPFFLLAIRLFWGWQFFNSGIGKFADIDSVAGYFSTLGIPAPMLNAYIAATIETFGGLFLLLGLASRLIAIPLVITMIVALRTAHQEVTINLFDDPVLVAQQPPFTFLLASLIIFVFGPGPFSLDGAIKRWFLKESASGASMKDQI